MTMRWQSIEACIAATDCMWLELQHAGADGKETLEVPKDTSTAGASYAMLLIACIPFSLLDM